MSLLDTGPCQNWPVLCDSFPDDPTPAQQDLIDQSVQIATEVLWNRTKRRFGTCEMTFRPCREGRGPIPLGWTNVTGWTWPFPALIGGAWFNLACGSCSVGCSCSRVSQVRLPYPVAEVIQVRVDGAVLPSSAYRVDDHRFLVRVDGGSWPRTNDLSLDDDQPGTWSVTATYGEQVPSLGSRAAGQLAYEIYRSCPGSGSNGQCALPASTVRQVTRQGVTAVFFDAETAFANGKVGLYYPDLFISTYNPTNSGVASVYDLDGPRRRNAGSLPGPTH